MPPQEFFSILTIHFAFCNVAQLYSEGTKTSHPMEMARTASTREVGGGTSDRLHKVRGIHHS